MKNVKIIYWLPRILSIAFVLFLSLFALDVFSEYSGWGVILPFLMHLAPMFVLLAIIAVAWKYDLAGAAVFLIVAIGYILLIGFNRPWSWYVFISGPAALVAVLFFLSWISRKK